MTLQEVLVFFMQMRKDHNQELQSIWGRKKKDLTGKGKYMVKAVDQPLKKLAWKLKDKSSKINYNYRDTQNKKDVKCDIKNRFHS